MSSDDSVAKVKNGTVKGIREGSVTITAQAADTVTITVTTSNGKQGTIQLLS